MVTCASLHRWIDDLRHRLADGGLAGIGPIDIGDGTAHLPGETVIRVMLADLDHLDELPPEAREWTDAPSRRTALLDDFRRLRDLIT